MYMVCRLSPGIEIQRWGRKQFFNAEEVVAKGCTGLIPVFRNYDSALEFAEFREDLLVEVEEVLHEAD